MPTSLLTTKLYIPPVRTEMVPRLRLIERLNAGLHRKPTLISAPAGFGKTTLLSEQELVSFVARSMLLSSHRFNALSNNTHHFVTRKHSL